MRKKSILLVEDRDDDIALTLRAFEKSRIANDVVVCRDGADALDYLFARGAHAAGTELPEVVLLDLNLPKIDGWQVLERIRLDERTKHLPVVTLTSSRADEDILRSYRLGTNAYVRKPVDFAQFVDAVRTLGLFWLLLNETAR